jgi:hypothetical protein
MKMFISIIAAFFMVASNAYAKIAEPRLPTEAGIGSPYFEQQVQSAAYEALTPSIRFVFIIPAPASQYAVDEQLPQQERSSYATQPARHVSACPGLLHLFICFKRPAPKGPAFCQKSSECVIATSSSFSSQWAVLIGSSRLRAPSLNFTCPCLRAYSKTSLVTFTSCSQYFLISLMLPSFHQRTAWSPSALFFAPTVAWATLSKRSRRPSASLMSSRRSILFIWVRSPG